MSIVRRSNAAINALVYEHKLAEREIANQAPKRLVSAERAREIRQLKSQLSNARVNSKVYLEINTKLNRIYIEEMEADEAFAREHAI